MTEWKELRLGDICKTNQNSYSSSDRWDFVNYLDTGNITENKISEIQLIDLEKEDLPSRAKRKVSKNSIIYSTVRPNQKHFGIIKTQPENFLVSTGFAVIDVDTRIADPDFIFYNLIQNENTESLHAIAEQTTSAYPAIKPSDIENLPITLPSLPIQKKIATILSSIDDKIKLNNKINDNLEQQAQAIFKSWFVDFEPFGGEMPDWKTIKADDFFDITIGKTPPRKEQEWFSDVKTNETVKWVSISDMGNCGTYISNTSEYLTTEAIKKFNVKLVPKNTVILSFKLTVGRVAITNYELCTNEAIAHFGTDNLDILEYLYIYLKNFNYQTMGSTSSIAIAVNSKIIKGMPFVLPDDETLKNFHEKCSSMFEVIRNNQQENQTLANLRDTLLPKLMSGELDVDSVQL